jgi:hypothetical protein
MNMLLNVLLLSITLLSSAVGHFATPQAPDKLIYKGKTYKLFANPLESFYKEDKARPSFQIEPRTWSSGNQRGYVATWEVKDGTLYLTGIDSWICESPVSDKCKKADLKELFGEKYQDAGVEADWFWGELRMPEGEVLRYVHLGYVSLYERDLILKVESGKIVGEEVIDNTKKPIPPPHELERQELERMKRRGERP